MFAAYFDYVTITKEATSHNTDNYLYIFLTDDISNESGYFLNGK